MGSIFLMTSLQIRLLKNKTLKQRKGVVLSAFNIFNAEMVVGVREIAQELATQFLSIRLALP